MPKSFPGRRNTKRKHSRQKGKSKRTNKTSKSFTNKLSRYSLRKSQNKNSINKSIISISNSNNNKNNNIININNSKALNRSSTQRKSCVHEIHCSLCNAEVDEKVMLIPAECYRKHMFKGHRLCENCWFEKFAIENGGSHPCPGCIKNLPLICEKTREIKNTNNIITID